MSDFKMEIPSEEDGGSLSSEGVNSEAVEMRTEAGELRDKIENLKARIYRVKEVLSVHGRNLNEKELAAINEELEESVKELDFLLKDQKDLHRGMVN